MHHFGQTRSAYRRDHLLQTPETFVRAPLPGMRGATAIVHIAPPAGARFVQYTAEFERGGMLGPCDDQRFIYVLDGELAIGERRITAGGYAYLPACDDLEIGSMTSSRAAVIEKPYQDIVDAETPDALIGRESDVAATHLGGDPWLEVRALVPDDRAFDFRVNTMTFHPGAALAAPEIHVMEHGLLMLQGGGIYRLGDAWYPVQAGDFIWMAPYCPQWFGALGKTPAKYLIYKDWDREPK